MKRIAAAAVCAAFLCSCSGKEISKRADYFGFDTVITNEITVSDKKTEGNVVARLIKLISKLDSELSPYNEGSVVSRYNSGGRINIPLIEEISLEYTNAYNLLGEGVTPACGAVTLLWNVSSYEPYLPTDAEISAALENVKSAEYVSENGVAALPKGTLLDFGAAAKGFYCDKALDILKEYGVLEGKINAGSSALLYSKSGDKTFTAAVRNPMGEGEACLFETGSGFISTAGGYERYFEADGEKYSHIFDIKTGRPAETDIASATVVLPAEQGCGALSDIASTLIYIGGTGRISEYADKLNARFDGDFAVIVLSENSEIISAGNANIISVSDGFTERSENEG